MLECNRYLRRKVALLKRVLAFALPAILILLLLAQIAFAKNTYRSQKRSGELEMDIAYEDPGFARVEAETDLRAALERMRPEYREVICLYYLQELSVKMVAEVLGRNESTVRTQLSRAREQLKNFLEG